ADHTSEQTYFAPAKVNLFLHVLGRRIDGYHLIQSAMQLIDLADVLTILPRDDGRIVRAADVPGVAEEQDLAIRAARLPRQASSSSGGATIAITKHIPIGGELGGGSSDAATTLLALNHLWRLDWSRARLMELGATLGADVPVFIAGGSAFVEGIGEIVTPIELADAHYAVLHPGVSVPTALVFGAPELTRDAEAIKISDFSKSGSSVVLSGCDDTRGSQSPLFRNDLEVVACSRFDAVGDAMAWLSRDWRGASGTARMSGSGACVFRAFANSEDAELCVAAVPAGWSGWSTKSLSAHPHRELAADR
ncbi:MAG: 4-(cytidine 5'-diphospho)-2-C-methyl-D-erythritol kinase, partial [Burkholderiaceae bacterium]